MAEVDVIRSDAIPLTDGERDHDALLDLVGGKRFVLLGEASHGTAEFYRERARITRRLIEEKGFAAVAVEADWPDAHRVNCYVRGGGDDRSADEALGSFVRFPRWMWRNTEVAELVDWLRSRRDAGFYGLDLYSLNSSIDAVIGTLERIDPEAAARARERYACFDNFDDTQDYGAAAAFGAGESCEDEAVEQLIELCRQLPDSAARDDRFFAEQNARLVKNAEEYYRAMFRGRVSTWNLRDTHMADTLDDLADHLARSGGEAKIVVWAHNSHLGDARATEMGASGELNVGQLVRERHPGDVVNIGFTTYTGTVMAADSWGDEGRVKRVNVALDGSWEDLLHRAGLPRFLLPLRGSRLDGARLERAIGVIYRPQTERISHYFRARLADQFDAVIHIDETTALQPLAASAEEPVREGSTHG